MVSRFIIRAVEDPGDDEARSNMLLAACYAGIGFGNAGVHLPHGMSYPVSGRVKTSPHTGISHRPSAGPRHGFSVILNAPSVFRFTAGACPARHLQAAEALGADVSNRADADAGAILADRITWLMQRLKTPNGLREIGYASQDIPELVERDAAAAPRDQALSRPAGPEELARMFDEAMGAW